MAVDKKLIRYIDVGLVAGVAALLLYGLVAVYSATHNLINGNPLYFLKRQALWAVIGIVAAWVTASFDYRILGRFSRIIYLVVLALLAAVLVMGPRIMGAERWLVAGPIRIQPAEIAKIGIIVTLARHMATKESFETWQDLVSVLLHVAIPMGLVLMQPDLGTALVFVGILLGMMYVVGVRPLHLGILFGTGFVGVIGGAVVSYYGWIPLLKGYQLQRLMVFLNPYQYRTGAGWNVIQSMIAIGSGRFFGKGIFGGSQTQLNFLPARHTDFIFSVVGEEFGFVGALLVLGLFFLVLWRGLNILNQSKDRFGALIAAGILSMLVFHLLINIGMTLGIMPVTGLPLPFFSYGGSALLTNMLSMGLLLNISMRRKKITF